MTTDPPRFVHSSLDAARADGPSAEQFARMAAKLPLGGATGGGSGGAGAPSAPHGAPTAAPGFAAMIPGALVGAGLAVVVLATSWVISPKAPAGASASPAGVIAPASTSAVSLAIPPSSFGDSPRT